MKNRIIITLTLLIAPLFLSAQEGNLIYLFDEFKVGNVHFKQGYSSNALLNYDLLGGVFVFRADEGPMILANTGDISYIVIGDRSFEHIRGETFYEKIQTNGDGEFYVFWKSNMVSKGKNIGYGLSSSTTSIVSVGSITEDGRTLNLGASDNFSIQARNIYYLKVNDKYKSFSSEKTFLKLFKGHEAPIKDFIAKENINFSSYADIARLMDYCSQFM